MTIYLEEGKVIPLTVQQTQEGTTLFECFEPEALLSYLDVEGDIRLSEDCYLKGVAIPGEGAFFDLFDQLGSLTNNLVKLSVEQAEDLILSKIC